MSKHIFATDSDGINRKQAEAIIEAFRDLTSVVGVYLGGITEDDAEHLAMLGHLTDIVADLQSALLLENRNSQYLDD